MRRLIILVATVVLFSGSAAAQSCQNADFVITKADWYSESNLIEIGLANTGSTNLTEFNMTAEAESTEYTWKESIKLEPNKEKLFLMKKVFTTPVEGLKIDSMNCEEVSAESDIVYKQNTEYEGSLNKDKVNKTKINETNAQKTPESQKEDFLTPGIVVLITAILFFMLGKKI